MFRILNMIIKFCFVSITVLVKRHNTYIIIIYIYMTDTLSSIVNVFENRDTNSKEKRRLSFNFISARTYVTWTPISYYKYTTNRICTIDIFFFHAILIFHVNCFKIISTSIYIDAHNVITHIYNKYKRREYVIILYYICTYNHKEIAYAII